MNYEHCSEVRVDLLRAGRGSCLADLATEVRLVTAATPASEIDREFRADRQLRSFVVQNAGTFSLPSREHVESTLTGRLGYGLHARGLPENHRDRDVLVLTAQGPRVASVSQIFERLSADFRHAALHDSMTGLPNRRQLEERGVVFIQSDPDLAGVAVL